MLSRFRFCWWTWRKPINSSINFILLPSSSSASMSNTSANPTCRMTTRGGAKEKMLKVVAMVCSSSIAEESDHEDNVAVKSNAKKSKSKVSGVGRGAKNMTKKLASASELAAIEDAFLQKAEATCSNHPCHWTGIPCMSHFHNPK